MEIEKNVFVRNLGEAFCYSIRNEDGQPFFISRLYKNYTECLRGFHRVKLLMAVPLHVFDKATFVCEGCKYPGILIEGNTVDGYVFSVHARNGRKAGQSVPFRDDASCRRALGDFLQRLT